MKIRARESYVSWLALAVAFSPVLVDLARNVAVQSEDRVTLLAPFLLVLALRSDASAPAPPRRDGLIALSAGILIEMFGIAAEAWSLARLGLPLAALGLARLAGRPPLAIVALLFFAIPVPDTLVTLPSPALETAIASAAGAVLRGLGAPVEVIGLSLVGASRHIELDPTDNGSNLAVALAAFGWYSAASAGGGIAPAALRAAAFALAAVPLQVLAVASAGGLLAAGMPEAARIWLRQGAWLATSAVVLIGFHHRSIGALRRPERGTARIRPG